MLRDAVEAVQLHAARHDKGGEGCAEPDDLGVLPARHLNPMTLGGRGGEGALQSIS